MNILGREVPLDSTLSLLAYVLLIAPAMIAGFVFARRKMFEPQHKITMTAITLFNWVLIAFLMAVRYGQARAAVSAGDAPDSLVLLPTIHLVFGGLAQLLATYLVIRMWFEKSLPSWFKIKRIKPVMRLTLALWFITVVLGVGTYVTWYLAPAPAGASDSPVATPEVTQEADDDDDSVNETPEAPVETPAVTPEAGASRDVPAPVFTVEVRDDDDDDDRDDDDDDDDNSGMGSS